MSSKPEPPQEDLSSGRIIGATHFEHPIDAMYLIHKALRVEAGRVEDMARDLQEGDSLQSIKGAFNQWAAALMYHAEREDLHMTTYLPQFNPARDNESEHRDLGSLLENLEKLIDSGDRPSIKTCVKGAMMALQEQQHEQLVDCLEGVMAVLNQEIGKTKVVARTQRHLFRCLVALRVAQDDHLECEEEFVLPEIRQQIDVATQKAMVRQLLVDDTAEDTMWVIDWVSQRLSPQERQLLAQASA